MLRQIPNRQVTLDQQRFAVFVIDVNTHPVGWESTVSNIATDENSIKKPKYHNCVIILIYNRKAVKQQMAIWICDIVGMH